MALTQNTTKEYTLGRGKLYFETSGTDGFRYLGNTPGFNLTIETETLDHFSSSSGTAEKDDSVAVSVDRKAALNIDSMTADNLALFIGGSKATHTQSNTAVTDEAITVQQGLYYQLGESTTNSPGVRNVSSVVIQDVTDTTTYTEDTDYELDAVAGVIYIIEGGGISDGDVIHVDYTPASETRDRVTSSSTVAVSGKLMFKADNPKGSNRDMYCPDVTIRPTGELPIITENEWGSMDFEVSVNNPSTAEQAIYIDGRAA